MLEREGGLSLRDARVPRTLPVAAVLFDLDGTLADTAPDLAAALNRVRGQRGMAPMPLSALRPFASHGARGLLGAGFGITPDHADFPPLRDAFLAEYAAGLCVETRLFTGVAGLLDEIEARHFPWGIVTNKAIRYTAPLLDALGLSRRAGTVICGDTTPHAKPHPAPMLAAAAALGIAPTGCVYIGDAQRDVAAGVAAGMATLVARYGYIQPDENPAAWPADGMLESAADLLEWLPRGAPR